MSGVPQKGFLGESTSVFLITSLLHGISSLPLLFVTTELTFPSSVGYRRGMIRTGTYIIKEVGHCLYTPKVTLG